MPLFSVLIPTRNRADLLKYAIQSVLEQDCDDYELIISDNDSSGDTRRVSLDFRSPKLRYVNTGKYLTANDSYQFAYTQAAGDYILLLSDDDYLMPSVLRQVKAVIQKASAKMVSWGYITYYDNSNDVDSRNTIMIRKSEFTNKIVKISTKEVLKTYFSLGDTDLQERHPPHPSAICISRRIANEINNDYGVFYAPPLADISAISRSLGYADFLFIIDKPLAIIGRGSRSAVYMYTNNPNDAWYEHVSELSFVMFKGKYATSFHTESLLKVKHSDPERFKDYDLDIERYCWFYYLDMMTAYRAGYDISSDLREFHGKLSALPLDIQARVNQHIRDVQGGRVVRFLRRTPLYDIGATRTLMAKLYILYQRKIEGGKRLGPNQTISGDRIGVRDIVSCANHLAEIASSLKQHIDAWDYKIEPTWCE